MRDEAPFQQFDRYLAETRERLPDRYRNPGRPRPMRSVLHPFSLAPIGLGFFVVALLIYLAARWLGYPVGP